MLLIGLHALKQEVIARLIPAGSTPALLATANVFTANQRITGSLGINSAPSYNLHVVGNTYNEFTGTGIGNYFYGTSTTSGGSINAVYIRARSVNANWGTINGVDMLSGVSNTSANNISGTNIYGVRSYALYGLTSTGNITNANHYCFIAASPSTTLTGAGTLLITDMVGMKIQNIGASWQTNAYGIYIDSISGAATLNQAITTNAGNITFNVGLADAADFLLNGTTYALIQTDASDDELYLCNHTSAKLSFHGATPVVQQVLATGVGKTVDEVITFLQLVGLCKQA